MSAEEFWRFEEHLSGDISDMAFLEWKYFSFTQDDIEGFICYSLGNPGNLLGLKRAIISYAVYHEDGEEIGYVEIPKKDIKSGKEDIWHFGSTSLERKEEGFWRLKGNIDGMSWDLVFSCLAPGDQIHVDFGKPLYLDSWMKWIVFCNSADVEGTITIKGNEYDIQSIGYHDSNLGHWIPSESPWTWGHGIGRYENKVLSFSLAESRSEDISNGRAYASIDGTAYKFEYDEYTLNYDRSGKIPSAYSLQGQKKDGTELEIEFRVERTDKIRLKALKFIPLLDLCLQRGEMDLKIVRPDEEPMKISCPGAWEFPKKPRFFSK